VQCPVEEGDYVVEQTVALPKEIPKGALPSLSRCIYHSDLFSFSLAKFVINARGYTVDDRDLFCVDLKVNFMKRPFFKSLLGW
jgi:hypothetical protein